MITLKVAGIDVPIADIGPQNFTSAISNAPVALKNSQFWTITAAGVTTQDFSAGATAPGTTVVVYNSGVGTCTVRLSATESCPLGQGQLINVMWNGTAWTTTVIAAGTIAKISNMPCIFSGALWLECNGTEYSRTQYFQLFAAIGTTFGPGDGSTTFNVPTRAQARVSPPTSITNVSNNTDDGTSHSHQIVSLAANVVMAAISAAGGVSQGYIASLSVGQVQLKTGIGSVTNSNGGTLNLVLPGGQYGFYPTLWASSTGGATMSASIYSGATGAMGEASYISLYKSTSQGWFYANQRYVAASGEVYWIFIIRDAETKDVIASYMAPDHPCFGNGGDPSELSHPFPFYKSSQHEIIVVNPLNADALSISRYAKEYKIGRFEAFNAMFEINEKNEIALPSIPVTVGLPDEWEEIWHSGETVQPQKMVIPPKSFIHCKSLSRKKTE